MFVDEKTWWGLTVAWSKLPQMVVDRRPPPLTKLLLLDVAVCVPMLLGLVVEAAVEVAVVSFLVASSVAISKLFFFSSSSCSYTIWYCRCYQKYRWKTLALKPLPQHDLEPIDPASAYKPRPLTLVYSAVLRI